MVQVDAPGNVIAPGGPLGLPIFTDPTRPATRERRSGLGDAVVGASVQVIPPRRHHLALALTGSAKLPTASAARGLGTGKADYSVVAEAAVPGKVTPFAAVGHSFVGQPDGYRLRDVTSARGGVAVGIGKASEVSVSYNYASRSAIKSPTGRKSARGWTPPCRSACRWDCRAALGSARAPPMSGQAFGWGCGYNQASCLAGSASGP